MTDTVLEILAASREYIKTRVTPPTGVNPTTDTVEMAFVASGDPASGDWHAAAWTTDSTTTPPTYRARILVGPGGTVTLAVGLYAMYVRVTDNPEIPVMRSGLVRVT